MGQQLSRSTTPQTREIRQSRVRQQKLSSSLREESTREVVSPSHRNYVRAACARLHKRKREQRPRAHSRQYAVASKSGNCFIAREQEHPEETAHLDRHLTREAEAANARHHRRTPANSHSLETSSTRTRNLQTAEKKECMICTETRSIHRFPACTPTSLCEHEVNTCCRCLRTWIASTFRSKLWDEIDCPICSCRMQQDDIRAFAPREVFQRYADLYTRTAFSALPNFTWCPSAACGSGQIHHPSSPKFRCLTCKRKYCVRHSVSWHKGETCKRYDARKERQIKMEEDKASEEKIRQTTQQCPKCRRPIEKTYGCDHMTCLKCKHQFCWLCLAAYPKKPILPMLHEVGCPEGFPEPLFAV